MHQMIARRGEDDYMASIFPLKWNPRFLYRSDQSEFRHDEVCFARRHPAGDAPSRSLALHGWENRVVQPGCPTCRKAFYTVSQFIDHLSDDVLPPLLDRLSEERQP